MVSIGNIQLLRNNDVMLASFPRSGNTWVMNLLLNLGILTLEGYGHDLRIERAIDVPDEQAKYIPGLKKLKSLSGNRIAPYRVIKTHSRCRPEFSKSIYIIRDGRDVMVSYFHFHRRFLNFQGRFSEFLNLNPSPARDWSDHIESWSTEGLEVLFIRYENLSNNPFDEIMKILSYLREERSEAEIRAAISACHFNNLQKNELSVKPPPVDDVNMRFFRKGSLGEWKSVFKSEDIFKFKQEANRTLLQLGYEQKENWDVNVKIVS